MGVRLDSPNARPVVSDERSEEFRRSVKESLTGPVLANRSDGTKPGIGIERKNKPTFIGVNMYITAINYYVNGRLLRKMTKQVIWEYRSIYGTIRQYYF